MAVPRPREGGLRGGFFWLRLTIASAQCLRASERFFHLMSVECYAETTALLESGHYFSYHVCNKGLFTLLQSKLKEIFV